ncbi:3-deoxy-manno-octulosonate cytidylyltransferase [Rhodoligotrophos appendicifer]|uniref:3-deoxy-manno-octulosonate cytidylyltransferase n=1 Tax=Rhodoligotrophos appendicifer TaxID=987056 RepID=UPI0011807E27|nr:3-deoxy-manno-octulosonate cytidylyltransferase [Rhodoligotrophos appendicifer]
MAVPNAHNTLVVIPARMAATRLPGKPLADICGLPMIVHVLRRAEAAGVGRVVVACGDSEIAMAVEAAGGHAVMTDPNLASGSDRVQAAASTLDPDGSYEIVINLQGDLPTVDPEALRASLLPLHNPQVDIATPVARIRDREEEESDAVVKAIARFEHGARTARAEDFVRELPPDAEGPHLHHIGIYAFRRPALDRFVRLPVSASEVQRRLEQLRALDNGMRIDVALVDTAPFGVDTPADLERARGVIASRRA